MEQQLNNMPYERYFLHGMESLSNKDLIAILLRTGTDKCSVLDAAGALLHYRDSANENLSVLFDMSLEDLMQVPGIGKVKAVRLLCVLEIAKRIAMEKSDITVTFNTPRDAAICYMERLRHEAQETVILVYLDNKNHKIGDEILSVGTVNSSPLSPRDVFIRAAKRGAVNIMLLHNHPSGDPEPSDSDIEITRRISKLGLDLEIHLLDHLVIGDGTYTSLREQGYVF